MPIDMKLWSIDDDEPALIPSQRLDLEARLEEWLCHDIGLVSDDLLLIGRQIETAYGGVIDLLAIDVVGNLVVLELKRDKTPRDIVAQALDYASWVQDLDHEAIEEVANAFLKPNTLEQAFKQKFHAEMPDVLNERHRIFIVAASLDPATERIVKYLSETHDVDINAAMFSYFKSGESDLLGRSLLLDDDQVNTRATTKSKRRPPRSWEELRELASEVGLVGLYDRALLDLRPLFDGVRRTRTNVAFIGCMEGGESKNAILGVYPGESSEKDGLAIMLFVDRLVEYFSVARNAVLEVCGPVAADVSTYDPNSTYFFDEDRLSRLVGLLKTSKGIETALGRELG